MSEALIPSGYDVVPHRTPPLLCTRCGVIVYDVDKHDQFHTRYSMPVPTPLTTE